MLDKKKKSSFLFTPQKTSMKHELLPIPIISQIRKTEIGSKYFVKVYKTESGRDEIQIRKSGSRTQNTKYIGKVF